MVFPDVFHLTSLHVSFLNCCLLWIVEARSKDKNYIWISVWWKAKKLTKVGQGSTSGSTKKNLDWTWTNFVRSKTNLDKVQLSRFEKMDVQVRLYFVPDGQSYFYFLVPVPSSRLSNRSSKKKALNKGEKKEKKETCNWQILHRTRKEETVDRGGVCLSLRCVCVRERER